MNEDLRFRINSPSVVYEKFDDEFVLINLDSGNYYSFEMVGSDIWDFIQNGFSETEIIYNISQLYAGSHSAIENAVRIFLSELQKEGLIVPDQIQAAEMSKNSHNHITIGSETQKINFESPVLSKFTNMQEFLLVDPIHEIDYTDWPKNKPK
jgi:hypothetical protein